MLIRQKDEKAGAGYRYRPILTISNKSLDFIRRIETVLHGQGWYKKDNNHRRHPEKHAVCYTFGIPAEILRIALPQLKLGIKERQRKFLLEALGHTNHYRGTRRPIPPESWKRLGEIYSEMKSLNKKGPVG